MNPPTDTHTAPHGQLPGEPQAMEDASPATWAEALMALIASRIALIQLEARETAQTGVKRLLCVAGAVICVFFTWILLVAGAIGAIAAATGWPWHWLALAAAALHLLVAMILATSCNQKSAPAFPLTRAEFLKDREWIESLQNKPKSND